MFSEDRNTRFPGFNSDEVPLVPARRTLSSTAIIAGCTAGSANNLVPRNAVTLAAREQSRALLTKVALDNTAALSAFEAHLNTIAPLGSERYKSLIDCYTVSAMVRIGRG